METLGRYTVLDELPAGSTGRTFLVEDRAQGRADRVLRLIDGQKILSPAFLNMLRWEREAALQYRHMFAARIHEIDIEPDRVHIVTDVVDGMPLSALLARVRAVGERLPWDVVISFGVQIAWALQAAHARPWHSETADGLFHGRVTPDTVFVTYDGYARIVGLGLGRSRRCLPPSRSTLPYLAPELSETHRLASFADVYGLGMTLFDAIRGKRTFERDTVDEIRDAVGGIELPSLLAERADVPRAVDDLLRAMAHKVPSERPRDAGAVSGLLKGCLPDPDALYPRRLAALMAEHFPDRIHLGVRDRARLRRRLGGATTTGSSSALRGLRTSSEVDEFGALVEQLSPSRRLSDEPAPTPVFHTPSPAKGVGAVSLDLEPPAATPVPAVAATPPPTVGSSPSDGVPSDGSAERPSLDTLDRADTSDLELDQLVQAIVAASPKRSSSGAGGAVEEPSGAHHTITATVYVAERAGRPEDASPPPESATPPPLSAAPAPASSPADGGNGVDRRTAQTFASPVAPTAETPAPARSGSRAGPVAVPPFPPPTAEAPRAPSPPGGVLPPREFSTEAGALIGDRYRIIDVLGQGAAAVVYRAEHVLLRKRFAVKMLRPELSLFPSVVERFRREAQAVSNLDHPNVVSVTDFGQSENGSLYLVMPLIEGRTLHRVLVDSGRLSPRTAIEIALSALAGLEYAHERGLVHRDLKPDNLMIEEDKGQMQAKLLDFGIAKVATGGEVSPRITQTGMVPGTPAYMAPEQAAGEPVDARSDLYALGVVLYESLTGRLPFVGDSVVELLRKTITEPPAPLNLEPNPGVDTGRLEQVVLRAMAKEGGDRFPRARDFAEALVRCLSPT